MLGGFVDKANKLQLLFFKLDANSAISKRAPTVFTDTWVPAPDGQSENLRQEVDEKINGIHMQSQGILRCVISLPTNPGHYQHVFVYNEEDGDRMYMIMRFQQQLQASLLMD